MPRYTPAMPRAWVWALAALVVAAKLPTLSVPYHWDEMGWASQARWLSEGSLLRAVPGFHDPGAFQGRPPALFLAVALVWKATGHSIAAAHLLIAGLAAAGVVCTFLLGRRLWDGPTGFLAALLLLVSPMWFAQAGMFLGDLPVAALGVTAAWLALSGRRWSYLLVATVLTLVKETGVPVVLAIALYQAVAAEGMREKLAGFAFASLPLAAAAGFFLAQKLAYDHFAVVGPSADLAMIHTRFLGVRFLRTARLLLVDQNRFFLVGLIAAHFVVRRRWSREWWLFVFVLLLSGLSFTFLYTLPRYVLPVLPFLCLAAARALGALVKAPAQWAAAGAALLAATAWPLLDGRTRGSGETDLGYVEIARVHRAAARHIAAEHAGRTVLAEFPHDAQLRDPAMGYVTSAVETVDLRRLDKRAPPDLALVPVTPRTRRMAKLAASVSGWPRVARWVGEGVELELRARPGGARAVSLPRAPEAEGR